MEKHRMFVYCFSTSRIVEIPENNRVFIESVYKAFETHYKKSRIGFLQFF